MWIDTNNDMSEIDMMSHHKDSDAPSWELLAKISYAVIMNSYYM